MPRQEPLTAPPTYNDPDEWIWFWAESGQAIPLGISVDEYGRPYRPHVVIHLLVHQLAPSRADYPEGKEGRDMWRSDFSRFVQEMVGILSIPGLLELTWEELQLSEFLYEGTTRPHFPPNISINRETVARQLRRGVRGVSEVIDLEGWGRRRRNAMAGRDEEDMSPWPADSAPRNYNHELLLRVRATVSRNRSTQPAQSSGPSSSSAPASGAPRRRRSPSPNLGPDDSMGE